MDLLLREALDLPRYVELLRALLEIYGALEEGLDRHRLHSGVSPVRWPELYRSGALRQDLQALAGERGGDRVPVAEAALRYGEHLRRLAAGDRPWLLAGHAYARYLGDLHGGRVLGRIVAGMLPAPRESAPPALPPALAFYRFPGAVERDPARWRERIREGLDALPGANAGDDVVAPVLEEARDAFRRHIELFEELETGVPGQGGTPDEGVPGDPRPYSGGESSGPAHRDHIGRDPALTPPAGSDRSPPSPAPWASMAEDTAAASCSTVQGFDRNRAPGGSPERASTSRAV